MMDMARKSRLTGAGKLNIRQWGVREKVILSTTAFAAIFMAVLAAGAAISADSLRVNLNEIFIAPGFAHPFGTDWVGRDMLLRTVKGLSLSMQIGILCSLSSGLIALVLGVAGPVIGGKADYMISWLIDLVLSLPHTLIIILISIAAGGGLKGIVIAVTLTHWTSLTRVIRAEVMQIQQMEYTRIARQFGKSHFYIAKQHIFPHIVPQLVVGIVLIFPHAILHEASVTFLGFGLPPHEPAIGVILSESMKYLTSGKWWLAFFPGLSLVLISMIVDSIGKNIKKLINPHTAYQ